MTQPESESLTAASTLAAERAEQIHAVLSRQTEELSKLADKVGGETQRVVESLKAEIVHGKLQVTVADTGLGFGKAATAGTGVGLANIRERLQLLYGPRATLTVAANQPSGTVVSITVPYKTVEGTPA